VVTFLEQINRQALGQQIQNATEPVLRDNLIKVKERIIEYEDRLFADPFVVEVNGEKRYFFVHRTNNIMEQHFRQFNYGHRRIHGNHSVRRNWENMPEQFPPVANLNNPDVTIQATVRTLLRLSKLFVSNNYHSRTKASGR
jgi:hypothetical protein